jgi:hypothetical protein
MSSSDDVTLKRYCTISGRIPKIYADKLKNIDISEPYSERLLEYCKWEDYRKKNAYHNCIAKGSDFYLSVKTKYSLNDLKNAIRNFTEGEIEYPWHLAQMNEKYKEMKTNILSIEEKKGCALALSYYTGFKGNSDRSSRNTNVLIRGQNLFTKIEKWNDGKQFYPVLYFLTKALANLPFYWGYTVRCVDTNKEILKRYEPGTVVTWLQFSSSKIGKEPAPGFSGRNTWFHIYSFSSREISQFSIYSTEKEALYSPFSHFLVFKKEYRNDKTMIYMRQIEIGLYINNIIWTDDNILNSNWENKDLMEKAYSIKRDLKIIPKISTECALSFLKSFKHFIMGKTVKYKVITDMNRSNEKESHNAGARLVKYMQDHNFYNIEIMIFTSSSEDAKKELKKLGVKMNNYIKVTTSPSEALQFLISE